MFSILRLFDGLSILCSLRFLKLSDQYLSATRPLTCPASATPTAAPAAASAFIQTVPVIVPVAGYIPPPATLRKPTRQQKTPCNH